MTEKLKSKICNKGNACHDPEGPQLPIEKFSKRSASPDGHTYTCKVCEKMQAKASYWRRKEAGELELTEEEKEARKQFYKDYYRDNIERRKEYDRNYQQTKKGKEVMKESHARRRKRIKDQSGEPYEFWEVVAKCTEDGELKCGICGVTIERVRNAHKDHIIPIAEGGKDELENVRITCSECNLSRPKDGSDVKQEVVEVKEVKEVEGGQ